MPDEVDAAREFNYFYGMPVHHHAGIYWGFLWVFQMNDPIHTELVTSRDGGCPCRFKSLRKKRSAARRFRRDWARSGKSPPACQVGHPS